MENTIFNEMSEILNSVKDILFKGKIKQIETGILLWSSYTIFRILFYIFDERTRIASKCILFEFF